MSLQPIIFNDIKEQYSASFKNEITIAAIHSLANAIEKYRGVKAPSAKVFVLRLSGRQWQLNNKTRQGWVQNACRLVKRDL